MDQRILANRRLWDEWTRHHQSSDFYDMASFRDGQSSLKPIEINEVGDVVGKSLLHLQCHFGQDTLSWARAGAKVTGVDLSPEAIRVAESLATELGVGARFVCSDVLDLTALGEETFDIVFTSYGALNWLPDLDRWARTIARHLRAGGSFYIVEFHPVIGMLDDDAREIESSYFEGEAESGEATESYTGATHSPITYYGWQHSLAEIVGALLDAGLIIRSLREFPYCLHNCFPFLMEQEPGRYVVRNHPGKLPLLFSIRAEKAR